MGGWKNRRGVDLGLKAFAQARQQEPDIRLLIRSVKPLKKYVPSHLLECDGVQVSEGFISRSALNAFYPQVDVLLYPSRWEGFGLSLFEGLHAGLPVLAADGDPMRELVEHEHNGLLIEAEEISKTRLAPHYECAVDTFAKAMIRLARDETLRARLTCPEPGALKARQYRFIMDVRQLILMTTNLTDFRDFWEKRAKKLGVRASGYYKWNQQQFKQKTEQLWSFMLQHLKSQLKKNHGSILDFGCGGGRFSKKLAKLGFSVNGVDISPSMLAMARQECLNNKLCKFTLIQPGQELPFDTNTFDILWSFTVLQHVPDDVFNYLVRELKRVLNPGGLVLLFENTHKRKRRTSVSGHIVFRSPDEYLRAFPGVSTAEQIKIEGEQHTLFVGRVPQRN
ncbi:MAG: methyltransferase domain-containing protein [Candidatus Aminicenantes bacterium]|nr:MAG: methyltransferase domain-containing protein [Candidatus Aminicenantes bacterium]